jgi:hypothetical protein
VDQEKTEHTSQFVNLPTGKPHVSFSEVKTWSECSWRHNLIHVKGLSSFTPNPTLEFGTIVHDCLENFLKTRIIDVAQLEESFRNTWKERSEAGIADFNDDSLKSALQDSVEIVNEVPTFLDATFPEWKTIDAEHALYESIDGHPHAFKGFIDAVIEATGKRGKRIQWILDWKTSRAGWFKEKRQDETLKYQLALYKNFWLKKNPQLQPTDVRCGFVILKRNAKPGSHVELFDVSMGPVPIGRSLKVVNNMIGSVNARRAFKNRLSCTWCEFKETPHCT